MVNACRMPQLPCTPRQLIALQVEVGNLLHSKLAPPRR